MSERIWWDGRYLPKGEPWGIVEADISWNQNRLVGWLPTYGLHGISKLGGHRYDTARDAQAAVEQWVREQGEKA